MSAALDLNYQWLYYLTIDALRIKIRILIIKNKISYVSSKVNDMYNQNDIIVSN